MIALATWPHPYVSAPIGRGAPDRAHSCPPRRPTPATVPGGMKPDPDRRERPRCSPAPAGSKRVLDRRGVPHRDRRRDDRRPRRHRRGPPQRADHARRSRHAWEEDAMPFLAQERLLTEQCAGARRAGARVLPRRPDPGARARRHGAGRMRRASTAGSASARSPRRRATRCSPSRRTQRPGVPLAPRRVPLCRRAPCTSRRAR